MRLNALVLAFLETFVAMRRPRLRAPDFVATSQVRSKRSRQSNKVEANPTDSGVGEPTCRCEGPGHSGPEGWGQGDSGRSKRQTDEGAVWRLAAFMHFPCHASL